jgi:hypothetical protein
LACRYWFPHLLNLEFPLIGTKLPPKSMFAVKCAVAAFGLMCCFTLADCARQTSAGDSVAKGLMPFTTSRDQAIALVVAAKHSLGAEDLNTLALAYSDLQQKANAYSDFLVRSTGGTSFDASQNTAFALTLGKSIAAFNKTFATVSPQSMTGASVQGNWVGDFSTSIAAFWSQHQAQIVSLSPDTRTNLVKQMKTETVWPNYENIATETITRAAPH